MLCFTCQEEKAELKAQVYLLEKEKAALELQSGSWEVREQAYLVSMDHLKAEMGELRKTAERTQTRIATRLVSVTACSTLTRKEQSTMACVIACLAIDVTSASFFLVGRA